MLKPGDLVVGDWFGIGILLSAKQAIHNGFDSWKVWKLLRGDGSLFVQAETFLDKVQ